MEASPGHVPDDRWTAAALRAAVEALPADVHADVLAQLAGTIAHYDETGDIVPLRHFVDGLLMTARLYRNERVRLALVEADGEDARRGGPPSDGMCARWSTGCARKTIVAVAAGPVE